jgi:hypothetical protein
MSLRSRKSVHDATAAAVPAVPVQDPLGGLTSVGAALVRMNDVKARVQTETDDGFVHHRRVGPGRRLARRLLPVLDGLILLWFLAGVLNADLTVFDVTLAVAAALALLCTVAVAAWTSLVGEHLQRSRDPRTGDLVWAHLDATSWGMLGLTAVMDLLLGTMMWVRVQDEVAQAAALPGAAATVIALALAFAVVLVNVYVLALAFTDGSAQTRELDQIARIVRPHLRRERRARQRAEAAQRRIDVREIASARIIDPGRR